MRWHRQIGVLTAVTTATMLSVVALAQLGPSDDGSILIGKSFIRGAWRLASYDQLWRTWGETSKATNYTAQLAARYGLHPAPYANAGMPMGLRSDLSQGTLAIDCMLCHAGSILGKSIIGLGNSSLDMQGLFEDLDKASGGKGRAPQTMSHVRGTVEAFGFTARLIALRTLGWRTMLAEIPPIEAVCEDVPAWWLLKKKRTMYHTGAINAYSVRALMQFLLTPPTPLSALDAAEADFARVRAYILTLEPPHYPFAIDAWRADRGEHLFDEHCAGCHGTYGASWTYPNKIIEIEKIGTDRRLLDAMNEAWLPRYNASWFAQASAVDGGHSHRAERTAGYQAPPLDGIWATAPYLHNGSVPTLYAVLNSRARSTIFTRSFRTGADDYDQRDGGWKTEEVTSSVVAAASPYQRRQIYDTSAPGRGNAGHTYGDALSESDRRAIIEYLKTI